MLKIGESKQVPRSGHLAHLRQREYMLKQQWVYCLKKAVSKFIFKCLLCSCKVKDAV